MPGDYASTLQAEGLRATTVQLYLRYARRWDEAGVTTLDDLNAWMAEAITPTTPRGTVDVIRGAARQWAAWHGWEAPAVPKGRYTQKHQRDALTPEQVAEYKAMLAEDAEIPPVSRIVLQLLAVTASRITALCSAPLDGVDLAGRVPMLTLSVGTKRGKIHRIPLTEEAVDLLRRWVTSGRPRDDDQWLFPKRNGVGPIPACTVRMHLRQALDRAQEAGRYPALTQAEVTPHVLRHTVATGALRAGASLPVVQKLLGHENPATTARYLHPSASDVLAVLQKQA